MVSGWLLAPAVMGNQFGTHWYYERARGSYKQEQARLTKSEGLKMAKKMPIALFVEWLYAAYKRKDGYIMEDV